MKSTFSTLILEPTFPIHFFNLGINLILVLGFYSGVSGRRLIPSTHVPPIRTPSLYHPTNRPICWTAQVVNLIITQPDPKHPETMLFPQSFRHQISQPFPDNFISFNLRSATLQDATHRPDGELRVSTGSSDFFNSHHLDRHRKTS
jgi:hypothetical protein